MDEIDFKIKNISELPLPNGVHAAILRKAINKKAKPWLFFLLGLFSINFILVGMHINGKLIDAEFSDMVRDLLEVLDFNPYFLSTVFSSFFEIISPVLVLVMLANLTGGLFVLNKMNNYEII